jgi:hypothetical protein
MSDKRSVSTDALETLGTIITEGGRDAIHLAVEPIVAAHTLRPGDHVGIVDGKATVFADKTLGIVDPFLTASVKKGEKFWMVIYPRTIGSLRHVWTHPDFADAVEVPSVSSDSPTIAELEDKIQKLEQEKNTLIEIEERFECGCGGRDEY